MTDQKINSDFSKALRDIAQDLQGYAQYLKRLGYEGVPLPEGAMNLSTPMNKGGGAETLEMIRKDLGDCRRCPLHQGRRHIVFGMGDLHAQLVLVGEGPGYEEDLQGLPFVGQAGQLLTKILEAIHLTREEVYIGNIIKCRPPKNRNPAPEEIAACLPFLQRQIRAIRPRFICALGTFAAQTLLQTQRPISRLRGHFRDYEGIPVLPTYHPAFLLRNPAKKRDVWEDMQKLQAAYEKG